MKSLFSIPMHIADDFNLKTIASVQELQHHDMIYIYHHLKTGDRVKLIADGTNIRGDIRYRVMYLHLTLGYVTLGGYLKSYYEANTELKASIVSLQKEKFLPIKAMDIEIDIVKLKNVS